ncbi:SIR2 family NAD-dependent protein deacylase [Methanobrevibacter sp.]|uniref:SIR2 family NAD-dependent protein deacylase n=1 Tax=Methanobrevibacter sp. TaxID=66852 RepID=UPI0038902AE5
MERFVQRLDKAKKAIDEAKYIIIGAGAGLSTAAGIDYGGERFVRYFKDFIDEYGFTDMYSSGFYPFETSEEKWAYWARHIFANRYDVGKTDVYQKLLKLVENKEYFVLTTNVESQFWINGFEDERIFATQGDYSLLQCSKACHDKLYYNEELVSEWMDETENFKIPTDLVPKCPVCGEEMDLNLRKDNFFVEDNKWHEMNDRYYDFLHNIDDKFVFLEIGVGFNTPGIIRYPFEQMTYNNDDATLIRLNLDYPQAIPENKEKTISFDENVEEILDYWLSRI